MPLIDKTIEVLERTNDGDDLSPLHLKLLEWAVNGALNDEGKAKFLEEVYEPVMDGAYEKPWFHGIEHLTIDHTGWVRWKDQKVDHYSPSDWAHSEEGKHQAERLAQACRELEKAGRPLTVANIFHQIDVIKLRRALRSLTEEFVSVIALLNDQDPALFKKAMEGRLTLEDNVAYKRAIEVLAEQVRATA